MVSDYLPGGAEFGPTHSAVRWCFLFLLASYPLSITRYVRKEKQWTGLGGRLSQKKEKQTNILIHPNWAWRSHCWQGLCFTVHLLIELISFLWFVCVLIRSFGCCIVKFLSCPTLWRGWYHQRTKWDLQSNASPTLISWKQQFFKASIHPTARSSPGRSCGKASVTTLMAWTSKMTSS